VELLGRYSKIQAPRTTPLCRASGKPQSSTPRVHSAQKRLGPNAVQQLVRDYEAGRSTTWLMQTYGLGKGTVLGILREHGVKMRGQGIPEERLSEAIELYKSGHSLMRISKRFRCSAETVRQALVGAGVKLRRPWERGKAWIV
jgi:hypothetical protein